MTWIPTDALRWQSKAQSGAAVVHDGEQVNLTPYLPVLQQLWVCVENGQSEWRPVPTQP